MRKKSFSFCLSFVLIAAFCSGISSEIKAQEGEFLRDNEEILENKEDTEYVAPDGPYTEEEKDNKKREKRIKQEVEVENTEIQRSAKEVETSRENIEPKPIYNPAEPVSTLVDPENPVSFNFLYYIIQKFKFADVIDQ